MSYIFSQVGKFARGKFLALLLVTTFLSFTLPNHSIATTFNNPLVDAADIGDKTLVENLLKQGQIPDSKGDFNTTALMRAAFRGNTDLIQLLIENGAYVNASDVGGETALHLAAKNGHDDAIKSLLYYGAYIDVPDKEQWTPLMRATTAKQLDSVKLLIEKGADVTVVNNINESALVHAAIAGVPDIATLILGSPKAKNISLEQENMAIGLAKRKNHSMVEKAIAMFMENTAKQPKTELSQSKPKEKSPEPLIPPIKEPEQTYKLGDNKEIPVTPKNKALILEKPAEETKQNDQITIPANEPAPILKTQSDKSEETKAPLIAITTPQEKPQELTPEPTQDVKDAVSITAPAPILNTQAAKPEETKAPLIATNTPQEKAQLSNTPPVQEVKDAVSITAPAPILSTQAAKPEKTKAPLIATNTPQEKAQLSNTPPVQEVKDAVSITEKNQKKEPKKLDSTKIATTKAAKISESKSISLESNLTDSESNNSIFYIQLGTFKDDKSAESAWNNIISSNNDILAKLDPTIVETTLSSAPGDTVYRLRAGTMPTKIQAYLTCKALRSRQLECYVVEISNELISLTSANQSLTPSSQKSVAPITPAVPITPVAPIAKTTPIESIAPTTKAEEMNKIFGGSYPKLGADATSSSPLDITPKPSFTPAPTPSPSQQLMPWQSGTIPIRKEWKLPAESIETSPVKAFPAITPAIPNIPLKTPISSYPGITDTPPQQSNTPTQEKENTTTQSPPAPPYNNENFLENKDKIRSEIQEMTRENFFRTQGLKPPQRPKKEYDDFYKQIENNPKESSVSEAVLVPDETYFSGSQKSSKPTDSTKPSDNNGTWLNISNLPNENFANDYGMRMFKYDESLGNVQTIVTKPATTSGTPAPVTMRVGPLPPNQANTLCDTVKAGGFGCSIVGDEENSSTTKTSRSSKSPQTAEPDEAPMIKAEDYWINLGTFSNNSEAEYYWMFIKEDNRDIMNQSQYDISDSDKSNEFSNGAVKLRTGPFSTKQRATQLCSIMRNRNIACLVAD